MNKDLAARMGRYARDIPVTAIWTIIIEFNFNAAI
jgi:hypothetical protein